MLNTFSNFWPKNLFDDWFREKIFKSDYFSQDYFLEIIRITFQSRTCRSIYGGMTSKK